MVRIDSSDEKVLPKEVKEKRDPSEELASILNSFMFKRSDRVKAEKLLKREAK